jgi:hypothetical protein
MQVWSPCCCAWREYSNIGAIFDALITGIPDQNPHWANAHRGRQPALGLVRLFQVPFDSSMRRFFRIKIIEIRVIRDPARL